jgi:hypothetical protein
MIGRTLVLVAGFGGAVGFSQFPEFSQQYTQRLGGTVDELQRVVAEFDADAAKLNLTRDEAIDQLSQGGAFGAARADSMSANFQRLSELSADLNALQGAGPFTRASLLPHLTDPVLMERTWDSYKPAVPVTFEGGTFAALGFGIGAFVLAILNGISRRIGRLFRRPKPA